LKKYLNCSLKIKREIDENLFGKSSIESECGSDKTFSIFSVKQKVTLES